MKKKLPGSGLYRSIVQNSSVQKIKSFLDFTMGGLYQVLLYLHIHQLWI